MIKDLLIPVYIITTGYFLSCLIIWFGIRKTINENFFVWWSRNFICKLSHKKHHHTTKQYSFKSKKILNGHCFERTKYLIHYSCFKCNRDHVQIPSPD